MTARSLAAACDEFESYDSLPGVAPLPTPVKAAAKEKTDAGPGTRRARSGGKAAPKDEATALLERALRLGHDKSDGDDDWLHSSSVKQQMRRMDPSSSEKALGFSSFSDFLKSRDAIAELEETGHERLVRLRTR